MMNKQAFLKELRLGLSGIPKAEAEERIIFFSEMIDDRIEEGLNEEEAVSEIGAVDEVVAQILSEIPLSKLKVERVKPKRGLRAWEIVLLTLGSPIWLSLLIAAFAVVFSVYVVLWSVIISLWAVFVSVTACSLGGIAAGIGFAFSGNAIAGIAMIGAGIVCTGLSILMFYGCKAVTKGILLLTKKMALGIKNGFIKKEEA